jgi:sugar phosphate isomerase/epimerase
MNRRQLLTTLAALPAASQLHGQSESKYRIRSGLVAYSYRTQLAAKSLTYEDLIHRIADWGIDGLDCTVYWFPDTPNTPNDYLASLRKTAYKNGVEIYNAGVRVQLCQPTAELQRAQFENIRKWVDVADRLGASHVRVFGGPVPKDATEKQAIAWAAEVLKRGCEYAGNRGITLGVEDDGGLTTTAEPTIEIVKQAASKWAGINADSGNLPRNGYAQFEMMAPYTTSVHLKANIANAEGKKEPADWSRLLHILGKAGYRGYVGLEHEAANGEGDIPRLLSDLRALVRKVST